MNGLHFGFVHQPFADALLIADNDDPAKDLVKTIHCFGNAGKELELIPGFDITIHNTAVDHTVAVEKKGPGAVNL
jgi:hypothetical protein